MYNFAIQHLAFNTNQDMHVRRNSGECAWLLLQDFQFMNTKLHSSLTNSVNQQGGWAVAKSLQRFSGYEMTQHKNAFV
jgi:hypothetical protein